MPNIKSSKKRVKVIKTKTLRNKINKTNLKTDIKKANVALETNSDNKAAAVKNALVEIDKMVSKGILHKNTAARKKSKLAIRLNKASV